MERMTYRLEDQYGNPTDKIILESDYICMSTPKKLEVVLSRLAAIEDILGDEYDLDRLRELARADKEGRIRILSAGKGKSCGTCANFQPVPGHKCGDCKARKYFRASQSRRACSMYIGKDGNYAD